MRLLRRCVPLLSLMLLLTACGGDETAAETAATTAAAETPARPNACPVDGCTIEIISVEAAGSELRVTWETNFAPDFSKNHIHVFWDSFRPDQVSNDAAEKGLTQGEWVPTGEYPQFVTEGVVSTANRRGSTMLCVTAADRDHNVLDAAITDCYDAGALL